MSKARHGSGRIHGPMYDRQICADCLLWTLQHAKVTNLYSNNNNISNTLQHCRYYAAWPEVEEDYASMQLTQQ